MFDLPFEEYMKLRYDHAASRGFFKMFPEPECIMFVQVLWARRYWLEKNNC